MNKARFLAVLAAAVICCSACGAPSLRHKKEVNKLLAAGDFGAAAQKIEAAKKTEYSRRDSLLYQLDSAAVLHEAGQYAESDVRLNAAQRRMEDLFAQSVSGHAGRYLINDLAIPYQPPAYEQVLTHYYRAMNFLSQQDTNGALVEANRAVFFLDHLPAGPSQLWQNEPFTQYFMSLVFESAGKRDDARIARARAAQSNPSAVQALSAKQPLQEQWGEVILVHANGKVPLKKSKTFQVAWSQFWLWMDDPQEGESTVSPEVQNAITTGLLGNSITVAYPVLEDQPYTVAASEAVTEQGEVYRTQLLGDVAGAVHNDLKANETSTLMRMALRAAAKRVAAVQAKHAAAAAAKDNGVGEIAGLFVNILGVATEKADTRQWFTLPAEFRLTRFYVPAGTQNITLRLRDGNDKIVGEHLFEKVTVPAGGRVYLHYRTAK